MSVWYFRGAGEAGVHGDIVTLYSRDIVDPGLTRLAEVAPAHRTRELHRGGII